MIVVALCRPNAVPITMPRTSPIAQPVRQWSVAEIALLVSSRPVIAMSCVVCSCSVMTPPPG